MLLKPETLNDARKIISRVARSEGKGVDPISSIRDMKDTVEQILEMWDQIMYIGDKVGKFLNGLIYCITHPLELFGALLPWVLIVFFALIIIKSIGFDVNKYIYLTVIVLILIVLFC